MTEIDEVAAAIYNAHMGADTEKRTQLEVSRLVVQQMPGESQSVTQGVIDALLNLQREAFDAQAVMTALKGEATGPTVREQLSAIYHDYFNNYCSVALYAEHNGLTEQQGLALINLAREVVTTRHPES